MATAKVKARLKALRRKFGLGEFSTRKKRTGKKPRRQARAVRRRNSTRKKGFHQFGL